MLRMKHASPGPLECFPVPSFSAARERRGAGVRIEAPEAHAASADA